MNIIVDTNVWSEAFRKDSTPPSNHVQELAALVSENRVQLLGIIRMEILCGIKSPSIFNKLHNRLASFPDLIIETETYIMAAQFFNLCRSKGVQGSNNDFLICACAIQLDLPILTKDKDFTLYSQYIPIQLHAPRAI